MLHQTYYSLRTFLYFAQLQSLLEGENLPNTTISRTNGTAEDTPEKQLNTRALSPLDDSPGVCYGVYGCFGTEYPWMSSRRPVPSLPQSPETISVTFCLFTRKNPNTCQEIQPYDTRGILNSNLKSNHSLYAIIHGYIDDGTIDWMNHTVRELLIYEDSNVLTVDWGGGSMPPYSQATANCRLVGAMLGHLLVYLVKFGLDPMHYHLIGHSLGAHISGYAGDVLKEQGLYMARITGLDPAEPYFENTGSTVQLDPNDAAFVDIIHTDGGSYLDIITSGLGKGLGNFMPSGHLDFYPNGGKLMPGCDKGWDHSISDALGSFVLGFKDYVFCNHLRARDYFTESINSPCPFLAQECSSWENFIRGKQCLPETARMGFHADRWFTRTSVTQKWRKMFLQTNNKQPFCAYQYRVRIFMSESPKSIKNGADSGTFTLILEGHQDKMDAIISTEGDGFFEPDQNYNFIITGPFLGNITNMTLTWNHRLAVLNPLTWHGLVWKSKIFVHSIIVESLETRSSYYFCTCDEPILSGNPQILSSSEEKCPDYQEKDCQKLCS